MHQREIDRLFKDETSFYYNKKLLCETLRVYLMCHQERLDEAIKEIRNDLIFLGPGYYYDRVVEYYKSLKRIQFNKVKKHE